jgi:hypothetical protein
LARATSGADAGYGGLPQMQAREHLSEFCIDKLIGATLRRFALWEYRSNEGMPHRYESLLDEIERLSSYNTAWEFASLRGN